MQLEDGLSSCQLLQSIQKFPDVWRPLFQPSDIFEITADKFLDDAVVAYGTSQLLKEIEENTYKIFLMSFFFWKKVIDNLNLLSVDNCDMSNARWLYLSVKEHY